MSGEGALLFALYPQLCDLALLISPTAPPAAQGGASPAAGSVAPGASAEESVAGQLRACLRRMGQLMGLEP